MARGELRGVVALDGPSGTGKSTAARRLAKEFGAGYLDTGAMYRAATLAVLRAGVDPADTDKVLAVVGEAELQIGHLPDHSAVLLDGEDVSEEIRGPEVTGAVSAVSAVPAVRELIVAEQQRIIAEARDELGGVVVEGRDIGTVVAPDATLKVFLTASPDVRARRRSRQDTKAGRVSTVDATRADVERRDSLDSGRAVSPMRAAEDALEMNTDDMTVDDVLARLESLVDERGMRDAATESGA